MNLLRSFRRPAAPVRAEMDNIIGFNLYPSGRVEAVKTGSGWYGSGMGEGFGAGAFSETAIGVNTALSQSVFGWAAAYSVSTWVYRCIEIRKSAVHRMPWSIIDRQTKQRLPNHPLEIALKRNHQKVFKKVEQSQLLFGETFIEFAVNPYGYRSDLFWLNNLGMAVLIGAGAIIGYSYTAMQGGHGRNFSPDQVAFMKTDNPFNDLRGMSPTEVIMDEVGIDKDVARVVRAYYANDTRVGLLFIPKTQLLPGDSERFLDEWLKQNKGVNRAGKPNLMPFDMTVERVQEPASLDDVDLRESTRREIAAAYGVPLSLAGAWDDANYQSLPEQRKSFYEETIIPECDNIADWLNEHIMPVFDDSGDALFQYDYMTILALTEDAQKKNDIYSNRLVSGLITRAEARAALGHPVRDIDDVYYIPTGATVVPANVQALVTPTANQVEASPSQQERPVKPEPRPSGPPELPAPKPSPKQLPAPPTPGKAISSGAILPCYVILSLADNPILVSLQKNLRLSYPDVNWLAPQDFHVTMVYALAATQPRLTEVKKVLPKTINPIDIEVGPLSTFDAGDNGVPLILKVQPDDTLQALQAGLYGSFESLGLDMSEYSDPSVWQPHITLGYVAPDKPIPVYADRKTVRAEQLICSVPGNDQFVTVYATTAKAITPPQSTAADELAAWEKKALNSNAVKAATFVCYVLPIEAQSVIRAALIAAGRNATKAQIRAVFTAAKSGIARPPLETLDYWSQFDDLEDQLGSAWLDAYMARVWQGLEPSISPDMPDAMIAELLSAHHDGFTAELLGTDETPGPLPRLILAGMGAGNEALRRGSAANPQRPVTKALDVDWSLMSYEARDYAKQYAGALIKNVDTTTRQAVRDVLAQWIESGADLDVLKNQLRQFFADKTRAALIAETEAGNAYVEGAAERYRRADVQKVKLSRLNDGSVCETCKPLEGTIVLLSDGWQAKTGRRMPPFHPRCRHWIMPAAEE